MGQQKQRNEKGRAKKLDRDMDMNSDDTVINEKISIIKNKKRGDKDVTENSNK